MHDPQVRDMLARFHPELHRELAFEPELALRGDWVARSRAFALFEPVRSAAQFLKDSLRRRGKDGGRDLDRYDLAGLLLEAIDRVVEVYGLGESLTTRELGTTLSRFVEQMETANGRVPDGDWCVEVAAAAIDVLLNRRPREDDIIDAVNRSYVHRHLVPTEAAGGIPRVSSFAFLLLEEAIEGGRRVIQARQEAVMFTVRMLDFDLEEMREVLEDLLERQMQRGSFDRARRTAEQGRQVASGYAAKIRALLAEARRQPLSSGYKSHLAPILDTARTHLSERTRRERDLRGLVEKLRWEASAAVHDALDEIDVQLEASSHVYVALVRAIAEAPCEHQAQRARAFAGRVAPGTYPDPLEGVLLPALRLPAAALESAAPAIVRRLSPPARPALFDLASYVATAFRPEPAPRTIDSSGDADAIRELPHPDLPIEKAAAILRARLDAEPRGVTLSGLLEGARGDRALESALAVLVHGWRKRAGEDPEGTLGVRVALLHERVRRAGLSFDDVLITSTNGNGSGHHGA